MVARSTWLCYSGAGLQVSLHRQLSDFKRPQLPQGTGTGLNQAPPTPTAASTLAVPPLAVPP